MNQNNCHKLKAIKFIVNSYISWLNVFILVINVDSVNYYEIIPSELLASHICLEWHDNEMTDEIVPLAEAPYKHITCRNLTVSTVIQNI